MNEAAILETLKQVKYPGFSRDIVSFGIIKDIQAHEGAVSVQIGLTSGSAEVAQQIRIDCEEALKGLSDVEKVFVEVKRPTEGTASAEMPPGKNRLPGIQHLIAVASGKGGVGKSTASVNLACGLTQLGFKVGLLDCDIYGPSVPLMMGVNERPTLDEREQIIPLSNHGVHLMSMGFLLEGDTPVIWRGPMIMKTVQQFIHSVAWGTLDFLLVDLPPGTGDAQLSLCQTVPLDGGVVVTTPQEASLGVVRKGIAMFEKVNVPIIGLIENMSYFTTPTGERLEIFGHGGGRQEAERQEIPFLGEVPLFTEIREGGDRGIPAVVSNPESPPGNAFLSIAKTLANQFSHVTD